MPIYTKTGDDGTTSLYGGKRVKKSDLAIEACGTIDELSSFTGLVIAKIKDKNIKEVLTQIQKDLYQIMIILSSTTSSLKHPKGGLRVKKLEQMIDNLEKRLPKLNRFILPQGSKTSCWFHILRTICRRTERSVVRYFNQPAMKPSHDLMKQFNNVTMKYLNRLSDLFFVLARYLNKRKETRV